MTADSSAEHPTEACTRRSSGTAPASSWRPTRPSCPRPRVFANTHIDQRRSASMSTRTACRTWSLVGTQDAPSYDGWFLQILVNKGDRQFVDETADRVPQGEALGGTEGVPTATRPQRGLQVLDFNQDGAPDFFVEFRPRPGRSRRSAAHLAQRRHRALLDAQGRRLRGGRQGSSAWSAPRLVATRNGYSFITHGDFSRQRGAAPATACLQRSPIELSRRCCRRANSTLRADR